MNNLPMNHANMNSILVLNGANFKDGKENMQIVLGCMDLNLALRIEKPPSSIDSRTSELRMGSLRLHESYDH